MTVSRSIGSCIASVAVGIAMLLAGCAGSVPPAGPVAPVAGDAQVYRLGLGDKVRINVYGEPSLSGEFQVSGSGAVTMPLVGEVSAVGLTAKEFEAALVQRYANGYLHDPKIAVEVFGFRPFFILGEVTKPGSYPSNEGLTLLGAVASAGGFTYRANTHKAFLRRAGEANEHSISLNSNIEIRPGDTLRIGERYF